MILARGEGFRWAFEKRVRDEKERIGMLDGAGGREGAEHSWRIY